MTSRVAVDGIGDELWSVVLVFRVVGRAPPYELMKDDGHEHVRPFVRNPSLADPQIGLSFVASKGE